MPAYIKRSAIWPDPRVKPPFGAAEFDWGHPLAANMIACLLFNESGGATLINHAVPGDDFTLSGTRPTWRPGGAGLALHSASSGSYAINTRVINTAVVTLACRVWVNEGWGDGSGRFWGFSDGNDGGSYDKILGVRKGAFYKYNWYLYDGAVKVAIASSGAAVGDDYHWCGTADGTTARLYRDGAEIATVACGNTFTGYTTANLIAWGVQSTGVDEFHFGYAPFHMYYAYAWNKAIDAGLALWVAQEPYAMFRPIIRRRYFPTTASNIFRQQISSTGRMGSRPMAAA